MWKNKTGLHTPLTQTPPISFWMNRFSDCEPNITLMPNLTGALVVKWEQISTARFQNLVDRLPRSGSGGHSSSMVAIMRRRSWHLCCMYAYSPCVCLGPQNCPWVWECVCICINLTTCWGHFFHAFYSSFPLTLNTDKQVLTMGGWT